MLAGRSAGSVCAVQRLDGAGPVRLGRADVGPGPVQPGLAEQLGDALAHFGRIFRTLHVLAYVDTASYRRDIKSIRKINPRRRARA